MPTPLTRSVTRAITTARGDALVVTMAPEGVVVREKRRRKALATIPYGVLYLTAARISAEQLRRDKAAARKARKEARR